FRSDGSPYTMTGTSASTALAAGAALIYRSTNPFLMAAATEGAMESSGDDGWGGLGPDALPKIYVPNPAVPHSAALLNYMSYAAWAGWYGYPTTLDDDGEDDSTGNDIDSDGDGWTDKEEYFFLGSDPTDPSPGTSGEPPFPFDTGSGNGYRNSILASVGNEQNSVTFDFPLSCYLLDQQKLSDLQDELETSLFLRDGSELVIERTVDPETGIWETWPDMKRLESDHATIPSGLGPDTAIMRFTVDLPENVVDFYLYRVRIIPPSP
ncbi:MAG: hypothetical protein VYA27_07715, partial [Verrucomicrobiota bacterium]|nr:hypothetical protein [Verrucomicrobiota bacterium]